MRASVEVWLNKIKAENKQWLGRRAGRQQHVVSQVPVLQDYFSEEIPEAQSSDEKGKMGFWSLNLYGLFNGF